LIFPLSGLSHIPRNQDGVLYTDKSQLPDLVTAYNDYAKKINGMLVREDCSIWNSNPFLTRCYTYLFYESSHVCGYVCVRTDGDTLTVNECGYDSKSTLMRILGFLRLYDGQCRKIIFSHVFPQSTVDAMSGEFRNYSRETVDGPMIRVLDVKQLLMSNKYPQAQGSFTVKIHDDQIQKNNRCFTVTYCDDSLLVKTDSVNEPCVECSIQAFSLLVYGAYDAPLDEWCDVHSVTLSGDTTGFFRAFPRRVINMYDAF